MTHSLTVLICVHSGDYDHDSLLVKSLKSLENQTYKNFSSHSFLITYI